jgi:hypothetical protein
MPTRESLMTAVAFGSAVMFASMAGLTLMAGALTQLAIYGKKWSYEMTAITNSGIGAMLLSGVVMLVLAVVCGLLGWMWSRNSARRPVTAR